ncbi:MAG: hypothetical protein PQJ49_05895 [Sphaerochaetaceae bacterium]|nr:hypothetical protein [Sphaerochaetaceae bacterium]
MGKKGSVFLATIVGFVLAIVGLSMSQLIKTDFGNVNITEVALISTSGYKQSMEVYTPKNITLDNPGPAIVIQHGGNNNKEEMELYAIELSRRGYVVITNDMYNMGNSEVLPDSLWLSSGRGLYDAVKYARTLPFVDSNNISTLGYSRGGIASSECIKLDQENHYIKNVFIIHADPYYANENGYFNWYGDRNVAVVADQYDEFFFVYKNFAGGYSNDANKYASVNASSVNYIERERAQSFLNFGQDSLKDNLEKRLANTTYSKDFPTGRTATRTIYVTPDTHMTAWYSSDVVERVVSFFQESVPTKTIIANDDFIYPFDNFFSIVGMLGLLTFMVSLAVLITTQIKFFKEADIMKPKLKETGGAKGAVWLWGLMIITTISIFLIIKILNSQGLSAYHDNIFRSANPIYHGLIGIIAGTFSLYLSLGWYLIYGKKNKFDIYTTGLFINKKQLWKTILIALISVLSIYSIVFIANYFSGTKLLFAYWHIVPFSAVRIPGMLAVLPLFIIFYVGISVVVNVFDYTKALTRYKLLNHILVSFLTALPPLVVIIYSYGKYYKTGQNPMFGGLASAAVAVLPLPLFIFFSVLMIRIIYSATGNMYLGGIIIGIFASIIEWSVCEIRIPEIGSNLPFRFGVYLTIFICVALFVFFYLYLFKKIKKD